MASIAEVLASLGVPYVGPEHKHGRPGWVQVDCPWCGPGTGKYHLGISTSTGAAACWRCGRHNTAKVLAKHTRKPVAACRALLDGAQMVRAPARATGTYRPPAGVGPLLPGHLAYLERRGFTAAQAQFWGVQGTGQLVGKWRAYGWRLFIPIYMAGRPVSWTTRSIKPKAQRYLSAAATAESYPHKHLLYGADYAWHACIVHEGPLDCWATGPGAVALCGTGYTPHQVRALARYAVRCICFDAEPTAQARARQLARQLAPYPGRTYVVELESGHDTASADPAEVAELRATYLAR